MPQASVTPKSPDQFSQTMNLGVSNGTGHAQCHWKFPMPLCLPMISGTIQLSPRTTVYTNISEQCLCSPTMSKSGFGTVASPISHSNDSEHCAAKVLQKEAWSMFAPYSVEPFLNMSTLHKLICLNLDV